VTARVTRDFHRLPASNDIPDDVIYFFTEITDDLLNRNKIVKQIIKKHR